jgi:hypothetical protein
MENLTLNSIIKRNPEIITSNIDGEIVMMSTEMGEYYGLDEIGSRIWDLIENPLPVSELVSKLLDEFNTDKETCTSDTLDFLNELVVKKIVFTE